MDPEYAALLAKIGAPQAPPPRTVAEVRAACDMLLIEPHKAFLKPQLPPDDAYTLADHSIPVEGGQITMRCLVPVVPDETETFPLLFNMHGGGWSIGSIHMDDYTLRIRCVKHRLSVVSVEYRLAPEHPFPTPVNDCYAALKWVVPNAHLLKADLKKGFIVCGESAGGNLSAVLSHMARDDPFFQGCPLTGQFLCEPNVCHYKAYPEGLKSKFRSFFELTGVPTLTREMLEQFYEWYNAPPSDPRCSPLLYQSHEGLPKAYIQAMDLDLLRDDAFVYAEVLREAGVQVKVDLHPGVTHAFYYTFPSLSAAARVRDGADRGIEWLLNREPA
ncbi:Alpha/Beta hydrolase protein [Cubamyces lactineus]|nr:Alpha/Beta hydrolase protein [Cubamyces lactineus]